MIAPLHHYIPERGIQAKGKVKGLYGVFENKMGPKIVRDGLTKGAHRLYSRFWG